MTTASSRNASAHSQGTRFRGGSTLYSVQEGGRKESRHKSLFQQWGSRNGPQTLSSDTVLKTSDKVDKVTKEEKNNSRPNEREAASETWECADTRFLKLPGRQAPVNRLLAPFSPRGTDG